MLMTREQMRQDTFFDGLTEAILERDQPRTADLYFQMVARQRRSAADALGGPQVWEREAGRQAAIHLDVPREELVRRLLARGRGSEDTEAVVELQKAAELTPGTVSAARTSMRVRRCDAWA